MPFLTRFHIAHFVVAAVVVVAGCSKDPEVAKREFFTSGEQYLSQGKLGEASLEFRKAIQQDGRYGEARVKLAEVLLRQGDAVEGLREYLRAADLLPKDVNVQLRAGELLLLSRQFEDARTRAERILQLEARNVPAQVLRANALAGLNEVDAAYKQMQEAIAYSPNASLPLTTLAALELSQGRAAEAEAAFRRAVEVEPQSNLARVSLGNFLWLRGRRDDAETVLREAISVDAKDVVAHRALAGLLFSMGRLDDAEPHVKAIEQLTGEDESRLMLADYYLARGRKAEVKALLDTTLAGAKSPHWKAETYLRLASLAVIEKDAKRAEAHVDAALAAEPSSLNASLAKVDLLLTGGRVDDAVALAKQKAQTNVEAAPVHYALGQALSAKGEYAQAVTAYGEALRLNPRAVRVDREIAKLNLVLGKPATALISIRRVVTANPSDLEAQSILARAALDSGDLATAEPAIKVLAAQPNPTAQTMVLQGRYLAGVRQSAQARNQFERALQAQPDELDALGGLLRLDLQEGNQQTARTRVDARLAADKNNARLLVMAAQVYRTTGDPAGAERLLRQAIEVDATSEQAYVMLGEIYASSKRLEEARAEFQRLAERQPNSVEAATVVGVLYQAENKLDDAVKAYESAIKVDPRAPVAANNLAWLYAQRGGNLDMALQLAQAAKAQWPSRPEVGDTLGWVYYKKNLSDSAVTAFRESVEQAPRNPIYHYHLGLALAQKGDVVAARASLNKAIQLRADFPGVDDARRVLASLN